MLHALLRVLSGRQTGALIPLPLGRFLIGREEDCQLRPNSELISRHHCVFTNDDFTLRLRDLGSTNGTFVNGERLRGGAMLKSGDRVAVGKIEFEVLVGSEAELAAQGGPGAQPPAERPAGSDDTRTVAIGETMTEIPAVRDPAAAGASGVPLPTGDTVYQGVPGQAPGYMVPAGGYPAQYAPGQFPPGQYGAPPYGQQPYPYPGYAPAYPGYYPMPMSYPAQPMYAPHGVPAAVPEAPADAGVVPDVRLPDPASTGAKPPEPAPPKPADPAQGGNAVNVPETAANIIKQYLQRRPTT